MRKRPRSDTGGSLDSLLDTMTNVVGILVILLAVTQLGVSDAVNRIRGLDIELLDVSPETLQMAAEEARKLQELLAELRVKADEVSTASFDDLINLQRLKATIEELRRARQTRLQTAELDREKLEQEIEKYRKQLKELKQQYVQREQELERIKAILQETPVPPGPPPKFVYLPNPRPAPKGAQRVYFICRNGRIAPLDLEHLREEAEKAARFAAGIRTPKQRPGPKPKVQKKKEEEKRVVDCDRIVTQFKRRIIGDRYWRIRLEMDKGRFFMSFEPGRDQGESAERLKRPRSRFEQLVRRLDKRKYYARFLVWADSFDVYLEARRISQDLGLAAGWWPYPETYKYRVELKLPVICKGFEPPEKPPAPKPKRPVTKPTKPVAPKPPPPRDEID